MKTMKLALATAAIAACTTVFAADAAASDNDVEGQGIGAIGWTPVQVGLFAPVSIPWGFDWDVKGFDLDLFYIETVKLQGLGISGIASRTRDNQDGLLISGVCNWTDAALADVRRLQLHRRQLRRCQFRARPQHGEDREGPPGRGDQQR